MMQMGTSCMPNARLLHVKENYWGRVMVGATFNNFTNMKRLENITIAIKEGSKP